MSRRRTSLADVEDRTGRVDIALYEVVGRLMDRLKNEQGVVGLREHVLPIVEEIIMRSVSAENMIPREIEALMKVCALNRGAKGGAGC